jgi:hypothetical protein
MRDNCRKFSFFENARTIRTFLSGEYMDRRRNPRVAAFLPVRIWGLDLHDLPFTQSATVINMSSGGAVLQGITRRIRPGEVLDVQMGHEKAQFRVVWVGRTGTRREGEIGLEAVGCEPYLWDVDVSQCSQFLAEG